MDACMHKYRYKGPVTAFGKLILECWEGETCAVSKKKAINNLRYQFTKQCGRVPASNINFPGPIIEIY